jgi:hypothetical protein
LPILVRFLVSTIWEPQIFLAQVAKMRSDKGGSNEPDKIGNSCSTLYDTPENLTFQCAVNETSHRMSKLHSTATNIAATSGITGQE